MLLSSLPCCAGEKCCNETGKECSADSTENHHSEESSNSCSPFMVCGSCTGFVVIAVQPDVNNETGTTADLKTSYIQKYFDYYYLKFWQPPKIS